MAQDGTIVFPITCSVKDPVKKMTALEWHGNQDVRVVTRPKPMITEPKDAIIRVTATTICGSDLHLYHNEFAGLQKGDVLGHEFVGIVETVGAGVTNIKKGDKVVVSAIIADGTCSYCLKECYSCCDTTNPSKEMEELYGHRTAGLFGYSHLTGGYDGGQAEYVRVPYADVNCLKVNPALPDKKILPISDILCTAWHANELAQVKEGDVVAVWGCGPVGLLTLMWAKYRKAKRIIAIDGIPARLKLAQTKFGAEIIDITKQDVIKTMKDLVPGGPDVCIDAAGFRFPKSILHRFQRAVKLETDAPEILTECIKCVRKAGKISVIGDYYAYTNNFPIGAFMEKGLTMAGGQVFVQKYWKHLLSIVEKGEVDPSWIFSHVMPLEKAAEAYKMFDLKEDSCIKVMLMPSTGTSQ